MRKHINVRFTMRNGLALALALAVGGLGSNAYAGRGGSVGGIKSAIASGSADSIVSALEQSEKLVCMSCVEPVMGLLDYESQKVRDAAGWWLGKRGVRTEVLDKMTARLVTGQDPIGARNAADVLGGMRDFSAVAPLMGYLSRPLDEESGAAVARALGNIGHPSALPGLKTGMASQLVGVRVASMQAVRNLRAVTGQKAPITADAVTPLLTDSDPAVRREAAYTAGWLRDKVAVPGLVTALSDANANVRKAAAWSLGEIGDGTASNALSSLRNDSDSGVRSIANAAILRLK